jgi:hypothetical protein
VCIFLADVALLRLRLFSLLDRASASALKAARMPETLSRSFGLN